MIADWEPLILATKGRKQVTLNYIKKDGTPTSHTGGIYEIKSDGSVWLWDTTFNDTIRQFKGANITSFQVLEMDFIPPMPWPIKINGEIV